MEPEAPQPGTDELLEQGRSRLRESRALLEDIDAHLASSPLAQEPAAEPTVEDDRPVVDLRDHDGGRRDS